MLDRTTVFTLNVAQRGDALVLLQSLPDDHAALGFFDPQFRELLERQSYGNEGEQRQSARAALPAMSPDYIDAVVRELARVLKPSGYLMRWCDKYILCEAHHLRIPAELLKIVDLIATDNARMGMGYRARAPVVSSCWCCRNRRPRRARLGLIMASPIAGSRRSIAPFIRI